jgi:hypothetical protein
MPEINETIETTTVDEPIRKPISEAKLQANRRNGRLSHGAVTAAGKRRSSLNAYRSGIHGQIVCATPEELAVLQKHTSEVRAELDPLGPTESFLAQSISDNMLRINKIRAIEAGIFANGFRENIDSIDAGHPEVDAALVTADTWTRQAKEIMLLSTYEGRLTSILRKDRAELNALQATRKEAREKAMNQAEIFVEHAESKGETYEPGEDFTPASDHGGFLRKYWAVRFRVMLLLCLLCACILRALRGVHVVSAVRGVGRGALGCRAYQGGECGAG